MQPPPWLSCAAAAIPTSSSRPTAPAARCGSASSPTSARGCSSDQGQLRGGYLAAATKLALVEKSFFERRVQAEADRRLVALILRLEAVENEVKRLQEENDRLRAQKRKQRGET